MKKVPLTLWFLLCTTAAFSNVALANDCAIRLYGTQYAGPDGLATLDSINPATGENFEIGPIGFQRVGAMDMHPITNILYAIGERDDVDDQRVLITIDRLTGAGTEVAAINLDSASESEHIAGMSFDSSGTLYAYGSKDSGIYTIDVSDGTNVRIGVNTPRLTGNGVAFSPTNVLYHSGAEEFLDPLVAYLHTVNLVNGALTPVGTELTYNFEFPLNDPRVASMDYGAETDLYYAILKEGSQTEAFLTSIDVTTATVNQIDNTADLMDGIAYFCEPLTSLIDLEKHTNGMDADTGTGPEIEVGQAVQWEFIVTNRGETTLNNILVNDDQLGEIETCPETSLAPTESMTCIVNDTAVPGQYVNIGDVIGTSPGGTDVTDTDPSHYLGLTPSIEIEKSTNGFDADTSPGPSIVVGQAVTWTYVVTNTGETFLDQVAVIDDVAGVSPSCDASSLEAGEFLTCTATGVATSGQYMNTGSVTATPPAGPVVDDTDPSHYLGVTPAIQIEKATNGEDADIGTGPEIVVGQPVTWTYVVTNTGEVALGNIVVTDDIVGAISCPSVTLAAGEPMTCSANGTAVAGQYENIGSVSGEPPAGSAVTDTDTSHYLGLVPAIDIEKHTNGEDADIPNGPEIEVGEAVTWEYIVTNSGETTLDAIAVMDDQLGPITCPAITLIAGDSMTCSVDGTATAGLYVNVADVTGTPPAGSDVVDSDSSHYFGVAASIDIEKSTNGVDSDTPTGLAIALGEAVTWSYVITNTGNVSLSSIVVGDDKLGAVSCPENTLAPDASMTCTMNDTATAGQYANIGDVTGTPLTGSPVTDTDPSHYLGIDASILIEKTTNGQDSDLPPGEKIEVGQTIDWAYTVTNTSIVALTDVVVTDSKEVVVTCPTNELAASGEEGDSMTCTGSGTAILGQYENLGQVVATPPVGSQLLGNDASHYLGVVPSIDIEKSTNGMDADSAPGPMIEDGQPVTWTYRVTNTGAVTLSSISVSDDVLGGITCPGNSLTAGEMMTCTRVGTATDGQYANLGTVSGASPAGTVVEDSDASHYLGVIPSIDLEKFTNDVDADSAPGPVIEDGQPVTWTYRVTNTGTVTLSSISVSDDVLGGITCPGNSLTAGEMMTCTRVGTATDGQYANLGTVSGASPAGTVVEDSDASHYLGVIPSIDLEKFTNDVDADSAPGPVIEDGQPVTWTYRVTNTGTVTLSSISVSDDVLGGITCPGNSLTAGEMMTCTRVGTATDGQYANLGTVSGASPAGTVVEDTDASHYLGVIPSIDIEKSTNGEGADTAPGPGIEVGLAVEWSYLVTNSGPVMLNSIAVSDDVLGPITCPKDSLEAGEFMTCTTGGLAIAGQYANIGTVTGMPPAGPQVMDTDPSHYFGLVDSIDIEKHTNGHDADTGMGPTIEVGEPVLWEYFVTNTGDTTLSSIVVTDDQGVSVDCPEDTLTSGDSMTCTGNGIAVLGPYQNTGSVSATGPSAGQVTDSDLSHYQGKFTEEEVFEDGFESP